MGGYLLHFLLNSFNFAESDVLDLGSGEVRGGVESSHFEGDCERRVGRRGGNSELRTLT